MSDCGIAGNFFEEWRKDDFVKDERRKAGDDLVDGFKKCGLVFIVFRTPRFFQILY